jgi:CO/xanthine dehydrogenase Mo-binding subunit
LELLPAVFDPQRATEPGAPQLHGEKGAESRIADPASNLVAELQGEIGDVASGLAAAAAAVEGTWQTQRVAPTALETHCCTAGVITTAGWCYAPAPRCRFWSATSCAGCSV